jgi:hypothetical protein
MGERSQKWDFTKLLKNHQHNGFASKGPIHRAFIFNNLTASLHFPFANREHKALQHPTHRHRPA